MTKALRIKGGTGGARCSHAAINPPVLSRLKRFGAEIFESWTGSTYVNDSGTCQNTASMYVSLCASFYAPLISHPYCKGHSWERGDLLNNKYFWKCRASSTITNCLCQLSSTTFTISCGEQSPLGKAVGQWDSIAPLFWLGLNLQ